MKNELVHDGLTPLHFLKNEPKMGKKDELTSLQFFEKWEKKDGLTPLQFLKNEPKMGKKDELTPLQFFEK